MNSWTRVKVQGWLAPVLTGEEKEGKELSEGKGREASERAKCRRTGLSIESDSCRPKERPGKPFITRELQR